MIRRQGEHKARVRQINGAFQKTLLREKAQKRPQCSLCGAHGNAKRLIQGLCEDCLINATNQRGENV